ncbi:uncharacterized protein MYCFIDRAFT_191517 [Pseudocercospora fijiensis CIRAD86]|uniref:Glycosyltransferase family 25 protein n=1 Tax=Pseudocercospora fijiensis (strain CIRAD86) TaxID=383855 RepID=M2ZZ32_PSEFD|nr:uncharacterized protein MYCFIDRAFT_191517 [Pseudocercospora fijiensis CIRAD86]EME77406.1 hypothetical protein MYCFIDRAFT_191517 [Pseudocercospora fijiensis CIRAD86]
MKCLLAFAMLYGIALLQARKAARRDPTSLFFDPDLGFERLYTAQREAEAHAFIDKWNAMRPYEAKSANQSICIGIPTAQRANASYFETTVGSILAGLSPEERSELYVLPFIAHLDPQKHPAYQTSWLHGATDDVLIYNLERKERNYVAHLEKSEKNHHKKSLIDYKYILNACHEVGTPFILIVEDDVLAAAGWYAHLKAALITKVRRSTTESSLYLRLFYTEKNFGWNKEHWLSYLVYSTVVEGLVAGLLVGLRRRSRTRRLLTPTFCIAILILCIPLLILLFFATGRLTLFPLSHGLQPMDKYGCCSQALLYPRDQVPGLIDRFEQELSGIKLRKAVDALIETYADEMGLKRWAAIPSPFQHIGTRSGKQIKVEKSTKWGRTSAERIWNLEFESWVSPAYKKPLLR